MCSPSSPSHCRLVQKSMGAWIHLQNSCFSSSHYPKESEISSRCNNLKVIMIALPPSIIALLQESASRIWNSNFVPFHNFQIHHYTDLSLSYVQLRPSLRTPYLSAVVFHVINKQLINELATGLPFYLSIIFSITTLCLTIGFRNFQPLSMFKSSSVGDVDILRSRNIGKAL